MKISSRSYGQVTQTSQTMNTLLGGVLFVGGCVISSVLVLFPRSALRRPRVAQEVPLDRQLFLSDAGTLYSVLVAFGIFVVWSDYKEAATNLQHEATEVADLFLDFPIFLPMPLRKNISDSLTEYLNSVVRTNSPPWLKIAIARVPGMRCRSYGTPITATSSRQRNIRRQSLCGVAEAPDRTLGSSPNAALCQERHCPR